MSRSIEEQANIFIENGVGAYSQALIDRVKENGKLFSIERLFANPLLLAWIKAIEAEDMTIEKESLKHLQCIEVGDKADLYCLIANQSTGDHDYYDTFKQACLQNFDQKINEYSGWEAVVYFDLLKGEQIKSQAFVDYQDITHELIISSLSDSPYQFLAYHRTPYEKQLSICPMSELNHTIENNDRLIHQIEIERENATKKDITKYMDN